MTEGREHYVLDNQKLIHYLVRKHIHPRYDDYEDFVQEGNVGLILAAERFDESKGYNFSTYASSYIIGYLRTYRYRNLPMIKYPREFENMYSKVVDLVSKGYSNEEVMKELNLSDWKYHDILAMFDTETLDRKINGDDGKEIALSELIGYEQDFNEDLDEERLISVVDSIMEKATVKVRGLYDDYFYSSMFGDKITQEQLSNKYNISQAMVSRIIKKYNTLIKDAYNA